MEENNDKQNSVEISVNAKGQYSGKCKVYSETIEQAYELAIAKAEELENLIKTKNDTN